MPCERRIDAPPWCATRPSGCLSGLVGYLSYPDSNVVFTAAKAIWHLSSGSANRDAVKNHAGLFSKLVRADPAGARRLPHCTVTHATPVPLSYLHVFTLQRELSTSSNERVRDIVKQTIDNLSPAVKPVIVAAAPSENVAPVARAKPSRARPIKMKVEGISQEYWRATVERALIRVPGVISVTLDTVR